MGYVSPITSKYTSANRDFSVSGGQPECPHEHNCLNHPLYIVFLVSVSHVTNTKVTLYIVTAIILDAQKIMTETLTHRKK